MSSSNISLDLRNGFNKRCLILEPGRKENLFWTLFDFAEIIIYWYFDKRFKIKKGEAMSYKNNSRTTGLVSQKCSILDIEPEMWFMSVNCELLHFC